MTLSVLEFLGFYQLQHILVRVVGCKKQKGLTLGVKDSIELSGRLRARTRGSTAWPVLSQNCLFLLLVLSLPCSLISVFTHSCPWWVLSVYITHFPVDWVPHIVVAFVSITSLHSRAQKKGYPSYFVSCGWRPGLASVSMVSLHNGKNVLLLGIKTCIMSKMCNVKSQSMCSCILSFNIF